MTPKRHQRRSARIVQLPTGKTVEVFYFSPDAVDRGAPATTGAASDLESCPRCASELVYPVDWDDIDGHAYMLALRCPNCEWTETGTYDGDAVRRLDERLDEGERALMADLDALTRANAEEDFDRFIAALRADQVWPMDF
jgi:hypothetical protein